MTLRRLILSLYLALFVGVSVMAGLYFRQTRKEYNQLRAIETQNKLRLDAAEAKLKDEQKVLERLRSDPEFVERKIRERLEYEKPDDLIFRFDN